jgi:uncharacterized repeat protein (TIGR02059 family)
MAADNTASIIEIEAAKKEIAFIDTSVSGYRTFLEGMKAGVEVVLIDGEHDGLAQIAAALSGRGDIDAVHVFAHGAAGLLQLGTAHISLANIADYGDELAAVRAAMTPQGDLMIYGCDVAKGETGKAFIDALAAATGADVAASDDATGSALLGGNWVLEAQTGPVESQVALTAAGMAAYSGTLSIGDENFDGLGLIDAPSGTSMTAGNWKFTTNSTAAMAVADSSEFGSQLNNDGGAGDRAVVLNYNGVAGITTYTMGSADGTNFKLESFKIGQSTGASASVTISAYSNGSLVVAGETVNLSGSDSAGNITYSLSADNINGRYGTLTFNSAYSNIDEIRFVFSGINDLHIDDIDVSAADTTPPVFSSAAVNGATLVMTYTDASMLDAANIPAASSFAVTAGGSAVSVNSVAVNAAAHTVTLTLASAVGNGQAVTVAYTDPTGGNDTNAIQDAAGNDAATLSVTAVTNNTPDTTAPVFASAAVNGTSLVMTYTEANTLDAAHPPSASSFAVMAGGSAVAVNSVAVNAAAKTVTLTLASAVGNGQAVTVAYSDPTGGNDANAIQDAAGNDAATLSATSVTNNTPDTTPPTISGNIVVPANGAYHAGQTLDFTVTFDENVTVTGTGSTLGLTVGGTARTADYLSKTANSITYRYTVQAGDNDADGIAVDALTPAGTTIRDAAGNDANLTLAGHLPGTSSILVDTTAPAVSGNIGVPSNGAYRAGQNLDFTVTFDENVTVSGSDSTLGLTIGSAAHNASFVSSAGNTVTYRYTVQAGDLDADGIAVGTLSLGTSTIKDGAGNDASVTLAGHVPGTNGVLVDAIAPTVSGNIAVPANATYVAGQVLSFTVTFDENVTVAGTDSTLGLTVGATARNATFASSSGNSVTYTYTVQAGDNDADGIAVGAIALGTSTIRDASGNNAATSLAGHVPATTGVLVDTAAPAVSGNIAVPANGAYRAGQTLDFTVTFDENVTVVGTDSGLGLTVGSTARTADYLSKTGNTITYRYTVQAGDTDADGIAVGSLSLGTSTIRDAAGNNANLSLATHVPSTAGVLVDTTSPAVAGNITAPANGQYLAGQNLDFTVTFDENVTVSGSDSTLGLTIGSAAHNASFVSSAGNSVTYRYTVQAGDLDADGIAVGALSLGTSTIKDAAGNDASVTLAGHVPGTNGVLVDAIVPTVSGNIAVPANATYVAGQVLSFTVTFDENVTVTGIDSTLGLTIGGAARNATFASSSGNSATYTYTVQAGDNDADGIAVGAIALGTSTIRDASGNNASTSLAGHVPATTGVLVDTGAPAVSGSIAVPANGAYRAGQTLDFTVTFDENVTVVGTDSGLGLTVGSTARTADYLSKTGNTITYRYTVQAGDTDADGIAVGSLSLGTSTIRDAAGNNANPTLAGHLPGTSGILVDTTSPVVSGNIGVPSNGAYGAGQNLDFTVTFDENVTVSGSDSTLGLTIGAAAQNASFVSSAGNTVTYRYTVQAGDLDADGIAVGALSLGTSTIKDGAGNDASVTLTGHLPGTNGVLVDGIVPTVSGNIAVPANATYVAGQVLSFTVTFDENVTVTGADSTLGLTVGGAARNAVFGSSSGNSVTYTYTVQAGDNDADGVAVGAIALGTSTIRDAAGNNAATSLAGHVPGTTGVRVDTAAPAYGAATVNEATLVMTYADATSLDAAHAPGAGAFTVKADGAALAVTAVSVNAAAHTVTLTLAAPVANGQAVTVAYADPTGGNDVNAIQDAAGNDALSLAATAVVNNTPAPVVEPPVQTSTVDGVVVQTSTIVNSDGSTSQVLTIPIVTSSRVDVVGNNAVADIPLVTTPTGVSLAAQVPTGLGLQVSGPPTPKTAGTSLTDLIREIRAHTDAGSHDQNQLTGGGSGFLGGMPGNTPLIVQTIVPTAAPGSAATDKLVIAGTPAAAGNPATALVIDARALPGDSTIELHDIGFAAVIGAVRVTGGTGNQTVWGDGAAQNITLGAGDDIVHGGAGNDTVSGGGGNDQVFGDEGNDLVSGGIGNDTIDGGTGNDVLLLAGANRADYSLRVANGKLVMTHLHGGSDGVDVVANVETLRFSNAAADTSAYGTSIRLVEALTGAKADLATVDAMVSAAQKGATLAQIAQSLYGLVGAATAATSNDAFVKTLYQNVFHRDVDAGGLAYWTGKLQAGAARADVTLALANSQEKLAMQPADVDFNASDVATLVRMYSSLFDRKADTAGLNYWIAAHEAGKSMANIADAFVASFEASGGYASMNDTQFLNTLYQNAMHRQGQVGELQYWLGELGSGHLDRGDVLLGFANSAEKIGLIGNITTSIDTL